MLYEAFESSVTSRILVETLATGGSRVLFENAHSPFYLPTEHIVFQRSGAVWAARFDVDSLEVRGQPVPVLEDVSTPFGWSAQLTFSNDGTIAYVSKRSEEEARRTNPVWVGRHGATEAVAHL